MNISIETTTQKSSGIYRQGNINIGDILARPDAERILNNAAVGENELHYVRCDHSKFWSPDPAGAIRLIKDTINRQIPVLPKHSSWIVEFTPEKWNIKFRNMDFEVVRPVRVCVDLFRVDPDEVEWDESVELYTSLIASLVIPPDAMPYGADTACILSVLQSFDPSANPISGKEDFEFLKQWMAIETLEGRTVPEYGDGLLLYVSCLTPVLLALSHGRVLKPSEILEATAESKLH